MNTELIIDTNDRLTVRNTVDYVEVGSADVIKISQLDSTEVGANDSLIVTPYQSATSIDYKIPQSVTQGILDVAAIREDLLLKLADLDVAINYAKAYKDEVEESVRTQVFSEMDVRYLSNSSSNTATTDFIKAQVLSTDLSNMVIVTSTDTNGEITSTATLGELKDRYLEVGNSLSGFTSQLNANTTASSAAVTATQVLTAKVDGVEARLYTEEGVSVGQFSTFMIDGVLQPKPNAGRSWLESELAIGMVKLENGVQYQYLGGALGSGSNGWVRTDASANAAAVVADGKASTAAVNAATALGKLTDMASDNILSPVEKSNVVAEYAVIIAEQSGIDQQATSYGITTEKTAYDKAINNAVEPLGLTQYLSSLTTPVAWNVTTDDTTIVGTTFRSKFSSVYTTRQALLNAIAAKAKVLVDNAQTSANHIANVFSQSSAPTTGMVKNDIFIDTDLFYNTASGVVTSAVDKTYGRATYLYDGSAWVLQPRENLAKLSSIAWAGGANKLLYGPNGAITGWSFGDGSNAQSEFKIKADKFYLEAAGSSTKQSMYVPFSVDATSGEISFNGKVEFSSVENAPSNYINGHLPIEAVPGSTAVIYELYKDNNNLDVPITIKYGTSEPVVTEAYLHNTDDIQVVPSILPNTKLVITPFDNSVTRLIGSVVGIGDEVSFSGNMIESIQVYNQVTNVLDKYLGSDMVDTTITFNNIDPVATVTNSMASGAMVVEPDGISVRLLMPDNDTSAISYKIRAVDKQRQPLGDYSNVPTDTYNITLMAMPLLEYYIVNSSNSYAYLELTRHNSSTLTVDLVSTVKMYKTDTYALIDGLENSFRLVLATDVDNLHYAYAIKFNNKEFADIVEITPSQLNKESISEIAFSKYPSSAKILALTKAGSSTYLLTKTSVVERYAAYIATNTYGVFSDISFFGEGYIYLDGANIEGTYVSIYDYKLSGFSNYILKEISYIRTLEGKWHRISDSTSITTSTLTNALARPTTVIDGGRIKTDTIDARSIVANSITSEQITTGTLRGLKIEGGEVMGGAIYGAYIKGAVIEGAVIQSSFIEAGVTSRFISDSVTGTSDMLYIDTVDSAHLSDPVIVKSELLPYADNLAKITLGGSDYLVTSENVSSGIFNRYFRLECNKTFISASIEKTHKISSYYQWSPASTPISTSLTRYNDYKVKTLNRLVKPTPLLHVNETALLAVPGSLGTDDTWVCAVGVLNDYTIWLQGSRNDIWTMTATAYVGNVSIVDRAPIGTPTVVGSYTVTEYWDESDKEFTLSGITFKLSLGKNVSESSWDDSSGYSMGYTSYKVSLSIVTQDFTLNPTSTGEIVVRDCSVIDANTSEGVVGYVTLTIPTITEIL